MAETQLDISTIPPDLAQRILTLGKVEWGATSAKSDAEHLEDFASSLQITREHHKTEGPQSLHGVYISGSETVLCHTGTSPNSPAHAQIMAGLWNSVFDALSKLNGASHDR